VEYIRLRLKWQNKSKEGEEFCQKWKGWHVCIQDLSSYLNWVSEMALICSNYSVSSHNSSL